MRSFLVLATVVIYLGLLLTGSTAPSTSTTANLFGSKIQPYEVLLGKNAKAGGQGAKAVYFTHEKHATKPYSADGKSVIGCTECHHTDQPKSALRGVLKTSERDEFLTPCLLEKADAKPVKTCRECHAQIDIKPTGRPANPEVTYPDDSEPVTLTNEEIYHRNCNVCHDEVKKRDPKTIAPVTCLQCHGGARDISTVGASTRRPTGPCETPIVSRAPTAAATPAPTVTNTQTARSLPPIVTFRSREDTYRRVAETLVSEGRLNDATSAIGLLKKEEYSNFRSNETTEVDGRSDPQELTKKLADMEAERQRLRAKQPRTAKEQERLKEIEEELRVAKAKTKAPATSGPGENLANLTPKEAQIVSDVSQIRDRIVAFSLERRALRDKQARTATEQERLDELDEYIRVAGRAHGTLVNQMFVEFAASPGLIDRVFGLIDSKALMQDLDEMGTGAVALYTIVGKDRYRVILITPNVMVSGETPINANDLQNKVRALRDALQNPRTNPKPLAQELYSILIGPVAKDLRAAKAETLMWSLDGVLRYLPFAALHDGQKYVVESYRSAVFTPASLARLKDTPRAAWRGLGLGVSKAHGSFPALPDVPGELRGIIRMANENLATGVINGKRMLNEEFTLNTWHRVLQEEFNVLHIASHFYLQRGRDTDSFLLLGDGSRLALSELGNYQNPFRGMDLVTLSACETALGSVDSTGREVEGFGVLAQRLGAKAVIASLWNVADESTSRLMREFYRQRAANPKKPKAEALRLAQLALLNGGLKSSDAGNKDRGIRVGLGKSRERGDYSHPYFWAPFILIGNWK